MHLNRASHVNWMKPYDNITHVCGDKNALSSFLWHFTYKSLSFSLSGRGISIFFCSSNTEHQMNCIWFNQLFNEMSCSLCSSAYSSYSPKVNRLNFTVLNLTIADSHTKTKKRKNKSYWCRHFCASKKAVALKEETIFQYVRINRLLWHWRSAFHSIRKISIHCIDTDVLHVLSLPFPDC